MLSSVSEDEPQEELPPTYQNAVASSPSSAQKADVGDWKHNPATEAQPTSQERTGDLAILPSDSPARDQGEGGELTSENANPPTRQATESNQERNTNHDSWQSARSHNSVHTEPSTSTFAEKSTKDLESGVIEPIHETETSANDKDPFVVDWEPNDSENPQNWPYKRKWSVIGMISFMTFLTPLASSMFAPGVPDVMKEFGNTSNTMATFVVSVFVLGFAAGPPVVAPLSEMYGRNPVYHATNIGFTIFNILCARADSMGALVAYRFCAGVAGVGSVTNGGGSISDMMPPERRGAAMAIWAMGPLIGPTIGPIAGGYLIEAKGWRWVFWIITIASGIATVVAYFVLRETYPPLLLERRAECLRKATADPRHTSALATNQTTKQLWRSTSIRPARMAIISPVLGFMCVYTALTYGILYILFTTFTFVFEGQYGFSTSSAGLSYIGSGLGSLLGLAAVGKASDGILKRKMAAGVAIRPEDRLDLRITVPASLLLPAGLFIYGWSADKKTHWIVPMFGTAVASMGMIVVFICIQTYLVDAFTRYAASANAANTVLRCILGALLPLCGLDMYDAMGLGWGNTLLGFLALALAPVLWWFYGWGEKVRTDKRFQREW
ncbi:major facilitator superfamily domain-containing protein [Phyllosticta capitalensis]